MIKNGKSLFNEFKENVFILKEINIPKRHRVKNCNKNSAYSYLFNNDNYSYATMNSQINNNKINNKIIPLITTNENVSLNIKKKVNPQLSNNSSGKIIQKEISLNKIKNSPIKKTKSIQNIPTNANKYKLHYKINNIKKNKNFKNEYKIKNIHISLKKIKIRNQKAFSWNQTQKNNMNETLVYKSPKRQRSSNIKRNNINRNNSEIINYHSCSNLLSRIKISTKNDNLIQKPNIKIKINRKNVQNDKIILGNKKIAKKLLYQSKKIKMQFKKENEIIKMKKEFFDKNGIINENKKDYENKTIKIQTYFRRFLSMKKFYHLRNKFFIIKICKVNDIIINSQKKENSNNDNICLKNRKYILKYLLLKKEQNRYNILKAFFQKYKNKTKKEIHQNRNMDTENINNFNIINLRTKKIKDLIQKRIKTNKEILNKYFLHYYYNTFYININFVIDLINQLIYQQKYDLFNNNIFIPKNDYSRYSYKKISSNKSITLKNNISKLYTELKEVIKKMQNTVSEEIRKFYLNDIIRIVNKINNEKEINEKNNNLKNFLIILFSKLKNALFYNYTQFFLILHHMKKEEIGKAKYKIDKINYIKMIMQKLHKHFLQKYFYNFILNIILRNIKKDNIENANTQPKNNNIEKDINKIIQINLEEKQ